ncbi:hypothetical protein OV203_08705 [Nannocystis sp. ILAH1]|uniref:hypothetical protein n=1 Tax=Nannocystis sp. ILAH1 TaxID=2996789 RepID=UPI002271C792|nr:hypothetical protein [Nannocystis sp. ILAH1]
MTAEDRQAERTQERVDRGAVPPGCRTGVLDIGEETGRDRRIRGEASAGDVHVVEPAALDAVELASGLLGGRLCARLASRGAQVLAHEKPDNDEEGAGEGGAQEASNSPERVSLKLEEEELHRRPAHARLRVEAAEEHTAEPGRGG